MERSDNNIIAEKLASLDSLPAGYEPNLESKWTLLEVSRQGRKGKRWGAFMWLRGAAVLVLGGLLGFLFLRKPEKAMSLIKEQSVSMQQKKIANESPDGIQHIAIEGPVSKKLSVKKRFLSEEKSEKKVEQELPVELAAVPEDTIRSVEEIVLQPVEGKQANRKKKIRYVQMDFGEPIDQSQQPASYASYPRFRMFGTTEPVHSTKQKMTGSAVVRVNF